MNLRDLRDRRGEIVDRMQEIHTKLSKEKRAFTGKEKAEWQNMKDETAALDVEISKAEALQAIESEEARLYGTYVGGASPRRNPETHWSDRGGELRVYKPSDKLSRAGETAEISFGQLAKALLVGPKNEAEKRALAEGVDANGGYLVPKVLGSEFIDLVRSQSHVVTAGARTVDLSSNNLTLAKLLTDPVVAWRNENSDVVEATATFGKVEWNAKSIAAYVPVSRELMQDAANMASILSNALSQAMSAELDRVCLLGTGVDPQPKGIINYAGTQIMPLGVNGGTITNWDILLDAYEKLYAVNANNPTAAIMHGRTLTAFNKLKDSTGQPLQKPDAIKGLPLLHTSKLSTTLTKGTATNASQIFIGDFTQLYIGVRQGIQIEISNVPLMGKLQTMFLIHARVDVAAIRENHFVVIPDVKPA